MTVAELYNAINTMRKAYPFNDDAQIFITQSAYTKRYDVVNIRTYDKESESEVRLEHIIPWGVKLGGSDDVQ